ncbi:MAG: triple tyrosine motif-containing protein, partial [Halioglobus sp.]|nr:triple tyrosine motif-containing protein [Halioglobus sp.]
RLVRLLVASSGDIWVLTKHGLILYDRRFSNTAEWINQPKLIEIVGRPQAIVEDELGNIWVGGTLGLAIIDLRAQAVSSFNLAAVGLSENSSITALAKNGSSLIIGTSTGDLAVSDLNTKAPRGNTILSKNDIGYISALLMHEDLLIIGSDRGIFASDSHLAFLTNLGDTPTGPSNPAISCLSQDGKSVLVGTINGLDILSFSPFELFDYHNSGVDNDVLAFEQDSNGRIWVGTYSGLYFFDKSENSHSQFELATDTYALENKRIATIAARKDDLWLGLLQNGAQVVDSTTGNYWTPKTNHSDEMTITKILLGIDEEKTWIASYNHGLFLVTSEGTRSYLENQSLPEKSITGLFRSKAGILLAVSEEKIYLHDSANDQFVEQLFEFPLEKVRPVIYSFGQAENHDIWIGTKDHGLFLWRQIDQIENKFHVTRARGGVGLATSTIYGIEIDSEGNLWCSTQNGVIKLDHEGQLIQRFTKADGLQGNDFSLAASFKDRDGRIYFGGVNGYNRFNPREVVIDTLVSPMRLTDIRLPGNAEAGLGSVSDLTSLVLTHSDRFVTFQFSVLDFIHPERNQFRYILENFDANWINSGSRNTATYTNLPAGEYILRIQGANSAGIWNREGITLNIQVLAALWARWWAYCIYTILTGVLIWGLHRIYQSYATKRRSKEIAKEMLEYQNRSHDEMQEQLELQDELIQSAYQHSQTILSLMNDCISYQVNGIPVEVQHDFTRGGAKRVAALSSLEHCLYYQAGGPVANLKKYTDSTLTALLENSSVTAETIITINEVSSTPLFAELASPLSIIIYELLENCIQHAFESSSLTNYIHITMTSKLIKGSSTWNLELSVCDSGIRERVNIERFSGGHSGIAIVQSIVKKLGGYVTFSRETGTIVSLQFFNSGHQEC